MFFSICFSVIGGNIPNFKLCRRPLVPSWAMPVQNHLGIAGCSGASGHLRNLGFGFYGLSSPLRSYNMGHMGILLWFGNFLFCAIFFFWGGTAPETGEFDGCRARNGCKCLQPKLRACKWLGRPDTCFTGSGF